MQIPNTLSTLKRDERRVLASARLHKILVLQVLLALPNILLTV